MEDKRTNARLWSKSFFLITLLNLLLFFGFQLLLPTLPVHVQGMGGDDAVIGWVTGLFTVSALLIRPFTGAALDRFGRKWLFIAGLGLFVLVTVSYSYLPTIGLILLFRFLHGFGWGVASTASNTIASDIIPAKRFGEGMAFFTLAANVAMAVAPAVGLYILHAVGFRTVSHLSALLVVGGFLLAFLFRYKQMDEVGETARRIAFIERSSIRPSLVIFFVSVTYGAINSFLSLYAREKGIENIGVFFTVYAVSMLLSRPGFGLLVDRKGVSVAVVPGMILVMLAMYALHRAESLTMFLVAAALYGVGFGASQTSLQTMAVIHAPRERLGIANSTFFTGFDSGIGVGSVVLGMVSKRVGYSRMFLISAASVVVALLLFFIFSLEQSRMSKEK